MNANTHNGVKSLLGQNFIKTGVISKEMGKLYNRLFNCRLTGDYEDNYDLCMEDIEPMIEPTQQFVALAKELTEKDT